MYHGWITSTTGKNTQCGAGKGHDMTYSIHATVNYPDGEEHNTPTTEIAYIDLVADWVDKLLSTVPDATSFVITIVKQRGGTYE